LAALTSSWGNETRTYDANTLQLTRIQIPSALDLSYVYPAAPNNNGRISAEINNLTNTQVSYAYDQVNRLATAVSATGGTTNWGLSFSYDVYGNRTAQTVTAGTAPAFSATFGSNNRMVGYSYDNNGNQLTTPDGATLEYDPDNRLTKWTKQGQVEQYQYHPSGWRLSKGSEKYLYGPGGQLLESYRAWNDITDYVYFGGRLLYTLSAGQAVTRIYSDRLGSTRATETIQQYGGGWTTRNYYPFGEEIGSTASNDYKFASTYRDSTTGLDYAVNRYYASGTARFLTPDPYQASGGPAVPQNWNRYAYVHNDPINYFDPWGTNEADPNASGGGEGSFRLMPFYVPVPEGGTVVAGYIAMPTSSPGRAATPAGGTGGSYLASSLSGFSEAFALAKSAFDAGKPCNSLFGQFSSTSLSPKAALDGLQRGLIGSISATDDAGFAAATTPLGDRVWGESYNYYTATDADGNTRNVAYTTVGIQINRAYWNGASELERARILIHELGHAFNILPKTGGSSFVMDVKPDGSVDSEKAAYNLGLEKQCLPDPARPD